MKKWIAGLLALTLALSMAACGGKEEKSGSLKDAVNHTAAVEPSEEKPREKPQDKPQEKPKEDTAAADLSMEPVVVLDNDQCTVKFTDIREDEDFGLMLRCFCENKSQDTTYMFTIDDGSVNGIDCDPFFASELGPGKKSNEEIYFWVEDLKALGVTDFTDIWVAFRVYDSDDYLAEPVGLKEQHIYPRGPENAARYRRELQPDDVVLMDTDEGLVAVVGSGMDEIWGYSLSLYIENRTDTCVMFSADDVSVNGYMVDPFFARSLPADTCAYEQIVWPLEELEKNGIGQVEEIEFILDVYDNENWDLPDFLEKPVTYRP